jgi:uncharacterized protein (DUF1499 family)
MKFVTWIGAAFALLAFGLLAAGQFGLLAGSQPKRLGVTNGRLKPPSNSPNSVSSQAALYPDSRQLAYASMDPIAIQGDGASTMRSIAKLLSALPRTVIVTDQPDYLYAQCSSAVFRFTDDVEFWLDKPGGVVHFRSASRLGRKDFGVNRARIEQIRAQLSS